MTFNDILVETQNEIGMLTLNSPATINALSRNMIREITEGLEDLSALPACKVIIIRANGKHFCSGHNLKEMSSVNQDEYKGIFAACSDMMTLIHHVPQIVIAQVHGIATAAGCQLVATCDLAVAEETARFGTPGVKIGLFCTTPMVALSRTVGRKRALEMLMTGELISAAQAEAWGLINKVVPADQLASSTEELAAKIAKSSPVVLALGKKAFYHQIESTEASAYEYAVNVMTLNLMEEDAREGIDAFLGKRQPQWKSR